LLILNVISKKDLSIKKILKIIWFAIASIALSGLVAYLSLFLAWGKILDFKTGIFIAIAAGLIFFATNTVKTINEKEIPMEKKLSHL